MKRLVLIHWREEERAARAGRLRAAGYRVSVYEGKGGEDLGALADDPPDAFVIDLDRAPSRGRDLGIYLRSRKATRSVPLVFAGGAPEKVAGTRKLLPDATYAGWRGIRSALRRTMARPPSEPVVRGLFDGYSGTPLPKKLRIRAGFAVTLLGAPRGFADRLKPLPEEVVLRSRSGGSPDVIVLFVKSRADLEKRLPAAGLDLAEGGALWIAWPKRASGVGTDLTQTAVRSFGLASRFVDYKIAAVDEIWSALCFARRRRGR